eukprot:scaffold26167_cov67-Isochrysis_galbana.AAC.2
MQPLKESRDDANPQVEWARPGHIYSGMGTNSGLRVGPAGSHLFRDGERQVNWDRAECEHRRRHVRNGGGAPQPQRVAAPATRGGGFACWGAGGGAAAELDVVISSEAENSNRIAQRLKGDWGGGGGVQVALEQCGMRGSLWPGGRLNGILANYSEHRMSGAPTTLNIERPARQPL